METQVTAENLHQDITAVKEVLHSRIRATESGLEGLELTQQRLTAELHAAKTAIMDEMMTELEACFATKDQLETGLSSARKMRPGAPAFVPSLCPPTGPGGDAALCQEVVLSYRSHHHLMDDPNGTHINFNLRCSLQ